MQNIDGSGAFQNIQEYPCSLDIKVIGDNEGPFVSDILTLAAEATGQETGDIPVKWRDKGKYRSITMTLRFENAEQVRAGTSCVCTCAHARGMWMCVRALCLDISAPVVYGATA